MNRAELLRERAELERRFAAIQGELGEWERELGGREIKAAPVRDRKKYTRTAVARRVHREETQRVARARVERVLARAPVERKWDQPQWVTMRKFIRDRDVRLTIPDGYPGSADPVVVVREFEDATVETIIKQIGEFGSMKVMLGMTCRMVKDTFKQTVTQDTVYEDKFDPTTDNIYFNCSLHHFTNADPVSVRDWVRSSFVKIIEDFEAFVQNGSGWIIAAVLKLDMQIIRVRPGRGGSHLETPAWIVAKKCCTNVRNLNNDCFRYALTAAIDRPTKNADRPAYYDKPERCNLFNLKGISMPAPCEDSTYRRFEAQNPEYSLLVYKCPLGKKSQEECTCIGRPHEKKCPLGGNPQRAMLPAYISPHKDRREITLLLLYDENSKRGVESHYITVNNWHALLKADNNKEATCRYCLHTFAGVNAAECLVRHQENPCGGQVCLYPTKGKDDTLEFEKQFKKMFVIYSDLESSLIPVAETEQQRGKSTSG